MGKKILVGLVCLISGLVIIANSDILHYAHKEVRRHITEKIFTRNYKDSDIVVFIFPDNSVVEHRDIMVKGVYYDIIRKERKNDKIVVYCLKDEKETVINKTSTALAVLRFAKNKRTHRFTSPHSIKITKQHQPSILPYFDIACEPFLARCMNFQTEFILTQCYQPGILSPPPEG